MKVLNSLTNIKYLSENNFFLIAGPCVVENRDICYHIAEYIDKLSHQYKIPYIFKASYRKANRSKLDSFTGIGDEKALNILKEISKEFDIPVITDIHSHEEAVIAAEYTDILQIPAFLCRQTDLLVAAARTGKIINIKKGQFLAPESIKFAINKITESGNNKIILTDRGTMFGYRDIIVDYRGIPEMQKTGFPVVLDITHSLQQPNQQEGISGGKPELIETIAKAGIAVGADGIFIETHPDPKTAKSDGSNMLKLDLIEKLLVKLIAIRKAIQ